MSHEQAVAWIQGAPRDHRGRLPLWSTKDAKIVHRHPIDALEGLTTGAMLTDAPSKPEPALSGKGS